MSGKIKLYDFQKEALEQVRRRKRCAFYLDMGLGKTFVGSEKAWSYSRDIIVICQKSKVSDWINHFEKYYECDLWDLTETPKKQHVKVVSGAPIVYVINYDIVWRRDGLFNGRRDYTLLLDESSCIQNETSKRTRYITRKMTPENIVLLSGTPCNGKYENLWTQINLLGYKIKKADYWNRYIKYYTIEQNGFPILCVSGYKNVDELKSLLKTYGAVFMKSDEVFDLPEQVITDISIEVSAEYKKFVKTGIVKIDNDELVGSTPLTRLLYSRELSGGYNSNKYAALEDILDSSEDRLVIFYNFDIELARLIEICERHKRPISAINGHGKNLDAYETKDNSITLIQYQSGAMGLNLQKANKIIFFSPPLSCELYLQAFKRIHRIGQTRTCYYWRLITKGIEEKIYNTLEKREDYTISLFEADLHK